MKKYLCALAVLLVSLFSASAISPFAEFQPIQAGKGWTAFNIQAGVTTPVHRVVNVGAGVGITERWNFSHAPLIPLFARCEVFMPLARYKFFFSFDAGYEVNTDDTSCGAVMLSPMLGLKSGRYYAGVGTLVHCWTPKHSDSTATFCMKVGMNF